MLDPLADLTARSQQKRSALCTEWTSHESVASSFHDRTITVRSPEIPNKQFQSAKYKVLALSRLSRTAQPCRAFTGWSLSLPVCSTCFFDEVKKRKKVFFGAVVKQQSSAVSKAAQEWTDHTRVILPRERGRHFGSCPPGVARRG